MTAKVIPIDTNTPLYDTITDLNGRTLQIKRHGTEVRLIAELPTLDGDPVLICFRLTPTTALQLQVATGMAALEAKAIEIVADR
ncbi:hypothetical protein [Nonomuraea glycinis]|uniref:hypothetical protein n=1 Tax=Nonomuraea glycinis TaxID=2047744 RepID=UPI0033AE007A